MKSNRADPRLFSAAFVAWVVLLGAAGVVSCGTSSRPGGSSDIDASTDSDTNPSLNWTFGNEDYDITVPNRLCDHHEWDTLPVITRHDGRIALPIARNDDNEDGAWTMSLATFPELEPWSVTVGDYVEECGYSKASSRSTRAFPHEDGFIVLAMAVIAPPDDWCKLAVSLWSSDAGTIGSSTGYSSFPWVDGPTIPSGYLNEDGNVVMGTITCDNCDQSEPEDPALIVQLDRFGPDPSDHGLLFSQSYSWLDHVEYTDYVDSRVFGNSTLLWNGEISVIAKGDFDQGTAGDGLQYLVLAEGYSSDGPRIIHSRPTSNNGDHPVDYLWSLTQREGTFLSLETAVIDSTDDPLHDLEFAVDSYVFSMEGDLLSGPSPLVTYYSNTTYGGSYGNRMPAMSAWSGEYFGVCYYDPTSTYQFMLLDENGQMLREPAPVFWDIPVAMFYPHACDIVALDEETFAIVLSANSDEDGGDTPGLWAVYVHANPPR